MLKPKRHYKKQKIQLGDDALLIESIRNQHGLTSTRYEPDQDGPIDRGERLEGRKTLKF